MTTPAPMKARVKVPASTSNLGAGFDCIGVAVDRWLTASVAVDKQGGVTIKRSGTASQVTQPAHEDLLHRGFLLACDACGRSAPDRLEYEVTSTIPVARGLGASAAALVAGAFLARDALVLDLTREQIADLCSADEGHPDNVAPAVFGGAMLGIGVGTEPETRQYSFAPLRIRGDLALVFAVPEIEVLTSAARAVLPRSMAFETAVSAVSRAAALVEGLSSGDGRLLTYALDDVVHVPYRRHLIPGYDDIVVAAAKAGAYGATLSGSGSTIVAIAPLEAASRVGEAMQSVWKDRGQDPEIIVSDRMIEGAGR